MAKVEEADHRYAAQFVADFGSDFVSDIRVCLEILIATVRERTLRGEGPPRICPECRKGSLEKTVCPSCGETLQ